MHTFFQISTNPFILPTSRKSTATIIIIFIYIQLTMCKSSSSMHLQTWGKWYCSPDSWSLLKYSKPNKLSMLDWHMVKMDEDGHIKALLQSIILFAFSNHPPQFIHPFQSIFRPSLSNISKCIQLNYQQLSLMAMKGPPYLLQRYENNTS